MFKLCHILQNILLLLWLSSTRLLPVPLAMGQTTIFPIFKQEEALRSAKSREVQNYMNLSANPCEDFYEYCCGNWNKYHTPSNKNEVETPQTLLDQKVNKDLHNLLDENVTIEDESSNRKVKIFYKSCLEAKRNEVAHELFISDFIKNNGGFPAIPGSNWLVHHHNYDWQHVVSGLRYSYGLEILIGMDIDINYQSMHANSIYLKEPSTLIPRSLCNAKATQRIQVTDVEYDAIEQEVAGNLKLWLSLKKEEALPLAADIVTFEYDLCTAMYVNDTSEDQDFIGSSIPENTHKKYARKTLTEFTHHFNNSLDFNILVQNSFGMPIYKPVFMKSPKYFEQLVQVIEEYKEYNKTIIANYIMYRALTYINLPLNDTPHNRPAYCLQVAKKYFPKVLGQIYHRKHANEIDQAEVETIFEKLKDIFDDALLKNWIDESTVRLGKKRLTELTLDFPSYDIFSFNLEFVRNDYWQNLKLIMGDVRSHELSRIFVTGLPRPKDEVEAFETRIVYRPYHKRIDIGWGLIQTPYYQPALPTAMRFALIGQKLAQTLASAFDDYGWTSDSIGHNNWDPNTAVEYYKRANCFHEQIGNYLYNEPQSFHNVTKTRDLIVRSIGLNTAFNAYLDWLLYQNPNNDQAVLAKETLPDLNFTNTQLFFVTFAQAHCKALKKNKTKTEPKFILSPRSRHSLRRYEVNGPLGNFIEFAREFHCPIGSQLNVADKCIIF